MPIAFDGTDDFWEVSSNGGMDVGLDGVISLSLWFKTDTGFDVVTPRANLAGIGYDGTAYQYALGFNELGGAIEGTGYLNFFSYGNGLVAVGAYSTTDFNLAGNKNVWFHAVGVFDGTAWHLYINGVDETNIQGTPTTQGPQESTELFRVGMLVAAFPRRFKGQVTDIRVFNRALSLAEAKTLFDSRLKMGGIVQGLVGYFPMDDQPAGTSADGDTVRDVAAGNNGTGNDGANNTGLTWEAETVLSYPPPIGD